jgi:hypothetical protein
MKKKPKPARSSCCVKMQPVFPCSRRGGPPWGSKGIGRWWAIWIVMRLSMSVGPSTW